MIPKKTTVFRGLAVHHKVFIKVISWMISDLLDFFVFFLCAGRLKNQPELFGRFNMENWDVLGCAGMCWDVLGMLSPKMCRFIQQLSSGKLT